MYNDIEKIKKRVLKREPKAKEYIDYDGNIYVDINGCNYADEYFYPKTQNAVIAWNYALDLIKVTQNFNRSHPEKYIFVKNNKQESEFDKLYSEFH